MVGFFLDRYFSLYSLLTIRSSSCSIFSLVDGIIIGGSKMEHLQGNLKAVEEGPLHEGINFRDCIT